MQENKAKYSTWVKGAAGTFGLLVMITAVFLLKAIISKKLAPWWFEFTFAEFAFKSTSYFEGTSGSLNIIAAAAIVLVLTLECAFVASKAQTKFSFMLLCQVITFLDTALLAYIMIADPFGDVNQSAWINMITHIITIIMLFSGIYAAKKLDDINKNNKEVE